MFLLAPEKEHMGYGTESHNSSKNEKNITNHSMKAAETDKSAAECDQRSQECWTVCQDEEGEEILLQPRLRKSFEDSPQMRAVLVDLLRLANDLNDLRLKREEDAAVLEEQGYDPWVTVHKYRCRCAYACSCYPGAGATTRREEHFLRVADQRRIKDVVKKDTRREVEAFMMASAAEFEMNSELVQNGPLSKKDTKRNNKTRREKVTDQAPSQKVEPSRRLLSFGGDSPIPTRAERGGRMVRGGALSGHHGSWTGSDDVRSRVLVKELPFLLALAGAARHGHGERVRNAGAARRGGNGFGFGPREEGRRAAERFEAGVEEEKGGEDGDVESVVPEQPEPEDGRERPFQEAWFQAQQDQDHLDAEARAEVAFDPLGMFEEEPERMDPFLQSWTDCFGFIHMFFRGRRVWEMAQQPPFEWVEPPGGVDRAEALAIAENAIIEKAKHVAFLKQNKEDPENYEAKSTNFHMAELFRHSKGVRKFLPQPENDPCYHEDRRVGNTVLEAFDLTLDEAALAVAPTCPDVSHLFETAHAVMSAIPEASPEMMHFIPARWFRAGWIYHINRFLFPCCGASASLGERIKEDDFRVRVQVVIGPPGRPLEEDRRHIGITHIALRGDGAISTAFVRCTLLFREAPRMEVAEHWYLQARRRFVEPTGVFNPGLLGRLVGFVPDDFASRRRVDRFSRLANVGFGGVLQEEDFLTIVSGQTRISSALLGKFLPTALTMITTDGLRSSVTVSVSMNSEVNIEQLTEYIPSTSKILFLVATGRLSNLQARERTSMRLKSQAQVADLQARDATGRVIPHRFPLT